MISYSKHVSESLKSKHIPSVKRTDFRGRVFNHAFESLPDDANTFQVRMVEINSQPDTEKYRIKWHKF